MLRLTFATLRGRVPSLIGSLLALFFASVLVTACGMLVESGIRAQSPPERYGAAPVVVVGSQWTSVIRREDGVSVSQSMLLSEPVTIPASLGEKIRAVAGTERVVPELTFPVGLAGPDGRLVQGAGGRVYGHAWESAVLTPYTLRTGRPPASPGEIVVDADLAGRAGLKAGGSARVLERDGMRDYTVTGIAGPGLTRQSAIFFTAERASELFGRPGQVSAFGVFGPGDPDRLRARVGAALETAPGSTATQAKAAAQAKAGPSAQAVAYAGGERGFADDPGLANAREALIALGGSIGGIALIVAVFVVAGTFALAVRQREREIALLRAIGATPRQIRAMTGREALLAGAVASAAGVLPGVAAGGWMFDQFVSLGILPGTFALAVGPVPMLIAVVTGSATAWLAARGAVRRASRIRPTEALGEAAVERQALGRPRLIAGLVFLAMGTALSCLSMSMTGENAAGSAGGIVILFVVAATLLGPWLVRLAAGLVGRVLGRASRVGGYLAVANTRIEARRLASVVSPLVLMLAFTATTVLVQSTIGHATTRQADEGTRADYVLQATGPGLPAQVARSARALPGVAGVTEVADTRVIADVEELGDRTLAPYGAVGLTTPAHGLDLDVREGSLDRLPGNGVALSTLTAGSFGVSVGDKVRLRLGDGTPITPTVVAVYGRGLGFGDVVLPYDLVRAHTATGMADRVLLTLAGRGDLRERLAALSPGLSVLDRADASAVRNLEQEQNLWVNLLVLSLIIGFTVISVVNTLVMATGARVREFALLRLIGGTRRQVLGMIRWEALLVGGIAVAVGTAAATPTLVAISYGLTGSPLPYVPPLVYAVMVVATLGLALAATAVPARAALLGRPVERIGG
ncbi:FtsX-like permease family protein [Streptosporangium sp. NPDC000396]|uniref:FtsX-like permease family protein n=1 Tax=Streptosporangium sp. NPDC000396 TaxID=3366185 RepID=UPI00367E5F4C